MNLSIRSKTSYKTDKPSKFKNIIPKDIYHHDSTSKPFSSAIIKKTQSLFKELSALNSQNENSWKRVQELSIQVIQAFY